jgi:hypothetical protein
VRAALGEARLRPPLRAGAVRCDDAPRQADPVLAGGGGGLEALAVALHDMHQAAGEAQGAVELTEAIRSQLMPVAARLDDEHAAADPGYAEAREALRLAHVGQASVRGITRHPYPRRRRRSRLRARRRRTQCSPLLRRSVEWCNSMKATEAQRAASGRCAQARSRRSRTTRARKRRRGVRRARISGAVWDP